ncbi:MAG: hypothetical protein JXR11_10110 [Balneola sp.]
MRLVIIFALMLSFSLNTHSQKSKISDFKRTSSVRFEAQRLTDKTQNQENIDLTAIRLDYYNASFGWTLTKTGSVLLNAADSYGLTGMLGPGIKTIGLVADIGLEYTQSQLEDKKSYLAIKYATIKAKSDPSFIEGTPEEFKNRLVEELGNSFGDPNTIDAAIAQNTAVNWLQGGKIEGAINELGTVKDEIKTIDSALKANEKNIKDNRNQIKLLQDANADLSENLKEAVQNDPWFAEYIMFSQKSPEEQIKYIESGKIKVPQNLENDIRLRSKRIETIRKRENFNKALKSSLSFFQNLQSVSDLLGIPEEVQIGLDYAITTGQAVSDISSIFIDPSSVDGFSYLQASGIVLGLAGRFLNKGQPTAEQLRFQAIMGKLNQMDRKLDVIIQNQQEMKQMLLSIMQAIESLGLFVEEFYYKTEESFQKTFLLLNNLQSSLNLINERLNKIIVLETNLQRCGSWEVIYNKVFPESNNYSEFYNNLENSTNLEDLYNCNDALNELFRPEEGFPVNETSVGIFYLENYPSSFFGQHNQTVSESLIKQSNSNIQAYIKTQYNPTFTAFSRIHKDSTKDIGYNLNYPSGDFYNELNIKNKYPNAPEQRFNFNELEKPFYNKNIIRYAEQALRVSDYYYLIDFSRTSSTWKSLISPSRLDTITVFDHSNTQRQLEYVNEWVSLGISQLALVSGNQLLEKFHEVLIEINNKDENYLRETLETLDLMKNSCLWLENYPEASMLCVLKNNDVLRSNFIRYLIFKELLALNKSTTLYEVSLNQRCDDTMLTSLFNERIRSKNINFVYIANPDTSGVGKRYLSLINQKKTFYKQSVQNQQINIDDLVEINNNLEKLRKSPAFCDSKTNTLFRLKEELEFEDIVQHGWAIDLGGYLLSMPSAKSVKDRSIDYPLDMYRLLSLRERLIQKIKYYEFYTNSSNKNKILTKYLLYD